MDGPQPCQAQGYEEVNSFEKFPLDKRVPRVPAGTEPLMKFFPPGFVAPCSVAQALWGQCGHGPRELGY
jgi:hypothetical protein